MTGLAEFSNDGIAMVALHFNYISLDRSTRAPRGTQLFALQNNANGIKRQPFHAAD
jgi:hypothetical protein